MTSSAERGDVVLPSDEWRELDREVVTVHVERAQRGMRGRKIRMDHLPHAFGTTEVLQPVGTQVGQVHAVRHLIAVGSATPPARQPLV